MATRITRPNPGLTVPKRITIPAANDTMHRQKSSHAGCRPWCIPCICNKTMGNPILEWTYGASFLSTWVTPRAEMKRVFKGRHSSNHFLFNKVFRATLKYAISFCVGWYSRLHWKSQPRIFDGTPRAAVAAPFEGLTITNRHSVEPRAVYTQKEQAALCEVCHVPEISRQHHRATLSHRKRA